MFYSVLNNIRRNRGIDKAEIFLYLICGEIVVFYQMV